MTRFSIVFMAAYLSSCVFGPGQKTSSNWHLLQNSRKMSCRQWPLRDGELRIDEAYITRGQTPGFLVNGTRRNGAPFHYWAPYSRTDVNSGDYVPINIAAGSVVLGGAEFNSASYLVAAHNQSTKSRLIIQKLKSRQPLAELSIENGEIVDGQVVKSRNGLWVNYKTEDNQYHLAFASLAGSKVRFLAFPNLSWKSLPILFPSGAEPTALLIWYEGGEHPSFKTQVVRELGTFEQPLLLPFKFKEVESWIATAINRRLFVATIEGDTLVGEAAVKISEFSLGPEGFRLERNQQHVLNDTHAAEPIFLNGQGGLELLVMNWIDEESTIARYVVEPANAAKPVYSGVFPKGTRIMGGFSHDDTDLLLTRFRSGTRWTFQLCQL